jgi:hypothetical protein
MGEHMNESTELKVYVAPALETLDILETRIGIGVGLGIGISIGS